MQIFQTINPHTETIIDTYPLLDDLQIHAVIQDAQQSYQQWRVSSFEQRKACVLQLAKLLNREKSRYASIITQEMGKPITFAEMEIEKCAWVCEYYAQEAQALLSPRVIQTEMQKSMVCYQPLGTVLAIMPWNFPFWQVFRAAIPCLMAGNTMILKHAPNSCGAGRLIESLFLEAGFPMHVFQSVILDNEGAAKAITHPDIVGVTLTGSVSAGRSVASLAGQYLKKVVLELGGNDAYVVLEDADLAQAARSIVASRLNNSGQVCIAAKRVIVVSAIKEQLICLIKREMAQYIMGDPMDRATKLGPMARGDLRDTVHKQVVQSVANGATLCMGGEIPKTKGFYYPPTLLTEVKPGMPAFDEELFGPVVCVVEAQDERQAISLANQSRFGLGGAVFTRDIKRGEAIAQFEMEAGACFVNTPVASDPRLPFGGIKDSGFGRELGQEGILAFVNIKTVAIL